MRSKIYIGYIISLFFLFLALYKLDFNEFKKTTYNADYNYLFIAVILTLVVCVFRSFRWRYLFNPIRKIKLSRIFSVIMIGFLANNILPARIGDVIMAYLIGEKENISKSTSLGTILIDRFLDFLTLCLFFIIALKVGGFPQSIERVSHWALALFMSSIVFLFIILKYREWFLDTVNMFLKLFPSNLAYSIENMINRAITGLEVIKNLKTFTMSIVLSMNIWLILGVVVYLLLRGFHINLSWYPAIIILTVVNLGLIIPSSPGSIGTFQYFCILSLGLFGIDKGTALSFSIGYHLTQYIPTTLVGIYFLARENYSFSQLQKESEKSL